MSRLNLEAFKAKTSTNQIEELESLTGGTLAECHDGTYGCPSGHRTAFTCMFGRHD